MTDQAVSLMIAVISGLLGGGAVTAVISWLSNKDKNKASKDIDVQTYWHKEFDRLEGRIADLETEVKGRDVSIAELKKENADLKSKYAEAKSEIARLTARIRELERLMRKYDIDLGRDSDE